MHSFSFQGKIILSKIVAEKRGKKCSLNSSGEIQFWLWNQIKVIWWHLQMQMHEFWCEFSPFLHLALIFSVVIRNDLILKNNHRPKKKRSIHQKTASELKANPIPWEYFSEVDLWYKWKQPNSYWLTQSKILPLYITDQDWDQAVRHLYIQL